MKKLLLIVCFCIGASALFSQDLKKLSLSFYGGTKVLSPSLNEDWPIRQDVSYGYYSDEFNARVNLNGDFAYLGISPEYLINKNWSVSSGLRFSKYLSSIIKDDYDRGGFFFLRVNQENERTDFARIKAIKENSSFIGIPWEVKYTPLVLRYFDLHAKLTIELAYRLNTRTDIEFKDEAMRAYQRDILREIGVKANPWLSTTSLSVGARLKLSKQVYLSGDWSAPAFYMTKNNSSLVYTNNLGGFQLSIDWVL
ncbi:MAG: hypothetical protein ACOX7E_05635 [Paludibacter sp.]|jgi:hypothetical protein|nr:hypothetical protein [Bacteroidales bacterium]